MNTNKLNEETVVIIKSEGGDRHRAAVSRSGELIRVTSGTCSDLRATTVNMEPPTPSLVAYLGKWETEKHYIIHRTGGVYSSFTGTPSEARQEIKILNTGDEQGSSEIQASFSNEEECRAEFYRLTDS